MPCPSRLTPAGGGGRDPVDLHAALVRPYPARREHKGHLHDKRHCPAARAGAGLILVELLVVMLVVGILAALAVPHFTQQRQAGYRAAVKSDLRNAVLTVEYRFSEDPNGFTDLDNPYFHSPSGIHWRGTAGVDVSVSTNPASTTTTYRLRVSHGGWVSGGWCRSPGNGGDGASCSRCSSRTPSCPRSSSAWHPADARLGQSFGVRLGSACCGSWSWCSVSLRLHQPGTASLSVMNTLVAAAGYASASRLVVWCSCRRAVRHRTLTICADRPVRSATTW